MEIVLFVAVVAALWIWQQRSQAPKPWHEQVKEAEETLRLDRYRRRESLKGAELEQFINERREQLDVLRRMRWAISPGTVIRFADGRIGTVVRNVAHGPAIKWNAHKLDENDLWAIENGDPETLARFAPDALLNANYGAPPIFYEGRELQRAGIDYEVVSVGLW